MHHRALKIREIKIILFKTTFFGIEGQRRLRPVIRLLKFLKKQIVLVKSSHCSDIFHRTRVVECDRAFAD
jgi:hypothetical protein